MYVALVVNYTVLFHTFKVHTKFIFMMDSRRLFTEWISNQIIEWVDSHCTWKLNQFCIYCIVKRCFTCHLFFLNMHVNNDTDISFSTLLLCLYMIFFKIHKQQHNWFRSRHVSSEVNHDAWWQAWTWEGGSRKKRKASANGISESWEGSQEKCWD